MNGGTLGVTEEARRGKRGRRAPPSAGPESGARDRPRWDPVNDFLLTYLDSIDKRLLEYLDEDDELSLYTVRRLRVYTSALLDGSIKPGHLMEAWPDWFQLAPAFVAAYGTEEEEQLQAAAVFLRAIDEHDDVALTDADLAYLRALEVRLDMYPEVQPTEE